MAFTFSSFESDHQGIVHDVVYDFFGKKIATAGSDGFVNIFETGDSTQKTAEIKAHVGSVTKISWAHPKFGNLLASTGFDCRVKVWSESSSGKWECVMEYEHEDACSFVSFGPVETGLNLVSGCSDGSFSLHQYRDNQWNCTTKDKAHEFGVTCAAWLSAGEKISFVTGGADRQLNHWTVSEENSFKCCNFGSHGENVRDLCFLGEEIASCGDDCVVKFWKSTDFSEIAANTYENAVVRLAASEEGTYLSVTESDSNTTILTKTKGVWGKVVKSTAEGAVEQADN